MVFRAVRIRSNAPLLTRARQHGLLFEDSAGTCAAPRQRFRLAKKREEI